MEEGQLREQVCQAAHQLWLRGLMVGELGLISSEEHRRRYVVTPPGLRRSDLQPDDLWVVDVGGVAVDSTASLEPNLWLPHRVAYQRRLNEGDGGAPVRATIAASPPMIMALARAAAGERVLHLTGVAPIAIVPATDEQALRQAVTSHQIVVMTCSGVLCVGQTLAGAMNLLEMVEHAAAIELAASRHGR